MDEAEQEARRQARAQQEDAARRAREKEEAENSFGHVPWGAGKGFACAAKSGDKRRPPQIVRFSVCPLVCPCWA